MKRLSLAATLIGFGLLAACSNPVPEGERALEVSDAYIVMPAGGQGIASGGMVVTVRGGDEMLTAATTDAADSVEIFGFDKTLAVGDSADIVLTFSNGQGKEQMLVTKAEIIGQGD